ncbi:hypothetical protein OWR29_39110 [Actinoplanes sp. Pm04-4]|uniref:Uncharacterized protein n=1 Tax=Paractinoplanes pyxinae TaxID=2997416 RepID=A0ABT4BC02_9ACTN|nr:hypothetical protein [Actinoplanes pyxinae]MCY1144041.1 hypothetical protein [Actinoplanes pyxinae]
MRVLTATPPSSYGSRRDERRAPPCCAGIIVNDDGPSVGAEQLRQHAANLDALRSLLREVCWAIWEIGDDQTAFGSACADALSGLGSRQAYQHSETAFVEESLLSMVEEIRRVADGEVPLKSIIRRASGPDVMTRDGTPVIEEPADVLHGLMDTVIAQVQRLEWVEPLLAGAAPVAEFAAPADESYIVLRTAGLHCALTGVDGLASLLDELTGKPEQVAACARSWTAVSADLQQLSQFLRESLDDDFPRRDQLAVRSYRAMMTNNVHALAALGEIATALSIITACAGHMILLTRDIIRGIIGDLVAQVVLWIIDTPGEHPPSLPAQLGVVVVTVRRLQCYIAALTASMTELSRSIDD